MTLEAKLSAERLEWIEKLINGDTPLDRFDRHTGVSTFDDLRQWAEMQLREVLTLRSHREDGKPRDDELGDYLVGKQGVLMQLLANMRQITERTAERNPA